MFDTVLPVWGAALLVSVCCWSIGRWLVSSQSSLLAMLAGWCAFLLLCSAPWIGGFSAHWARPLFWAFFAVGLYLAYRERRWADLICAAVSTAVITWALAYPFIRFPGMIAYGAHGVDMWGYVITGEWLQHHGIRTLPEIGVDPMRFNWTWHVLKIQERPLNYESLACLASSTGLEITKAYLLYPIVLLASLAMALAREPRVFGLKYWMLALLPAIAVAFHPLVVLPWIAGFFGGSIVAGFTAMAFAGAVAAEDEARPQGLVLAVLMLVFCAGFYTMKYLYVGLVVGAVPLLFALLGLTLRFERKPFAVTLRVEHRPLRPQQPWRWMRPALGIVAIEALAAVHFGQDLPANTGVTQMPDTAAAHFLGIFGGRSPFVWMGYAFSRDPDRHFFSNPVGAAALVLMVVVVLLISWRRWRASRDILVPLLSLLCLALMAQAYADELIMAKTLAIFGFTLLFVVAAASRELRSWYLGILAATVCCLPCIRSAAEMHEIIFGPYIVLMDNNLTEKMDGQDWRFLGYLHFKEDTLGVDWAKYPETYSAVTHFLPEDVKRRLDKKYHIIRN